MSTVITPPGAGAAVAHAPTERIARLQQATRDLEGVFVEQLFKAMRETVPRDGLVEGGSGEEMFTSLLDQKMAAVVPSRWQSGLSDALLRQLRGRVEPAAEALSAAAAPAPLELPAAPSSSAPMSPILNPNALPDASLPEPS